MARGVKVSEDLAIAVVRAAKLMPKREIAMWTGLGIGTIKKMILRFRHYGHPLQRARGRHKQGRKRLLSLADIEFLQGMIERSPDVYLAELQKGLEERRGIKVSLSTIWRSLTRCGYRKKKLSKAALERNEEKRANFIRLIGQYDPSLLVFVDESACDKRTTYRGYGWALIGKRSTRHACFFRAKRYSILPAISLSGIIHVKIRQGPFNATTFEDFIDDLLDEMEPYPGPCSVIVMDNCKIHKGQSMIDKIHDRGMKLHYLPPYSPDMNPIELAFSSIKSYIRRNGDEVRDAMSNKNEDDVTRDVLVRLHKAVSTVTAYEAWQYFHHCGYT